MTKLERLGNKCTNTICHKECPIYYFRENGAGKGTGNNWIPVTKKLPPEEEMVLVSCRTAKGVNTVNRAYYMNGSWHGSGSMSVVKAWQPMPDAYEGE